MAKDSMLKERYCSLKMHSIAFIISVHSIAFIISVHAIALSSL